MITKEELRNVAEFKIRELGGFLVDLKINSSNAITLFFDRMEGVSLEHCVQLSRYIEDNFDREIEDYALTVCSAGLDNPLIVKEQYLKNKGKEVFVLLANGKRKKGIILSYEDQNLTLQIEKKQKGIKKQKTFEKLVIPTDKIKETKLKINFK